PKDHEELFNLQHAQARNVVEHIFGIFKQRFSLMEAAPEYSQKTQAQLIAAFCAIHNFICIQNPCEKELPTY
ncbi:hypothetical protein Moror_9634, partial [Moniliophthora roreri MCA 2997]